MNQIKIIYILLSLFLVVFSEDITCKLTQSAPVNVNNID